MEEKYGGCAVTPDVAEPWCYTMERCTGSSDNMIDGEIWPWARCDPETLTNPDAMTDLHNSSTGSWMSSSGPDEEELDMLLADARAAVDGNEMSLFKWAKSKSSTVEPLRQCFSEKCDTNAAAHVEGCNTRDGCMQMFGDNAYCCRSTTACEACDALPDDEMCRNNVDFRADIQISNKWVGEIFGDPCLVWTGSVCKFRQDKVQPAANTHWKFYNDLRKNCPASCISSEDGRSLCANRAEQPPPPTHKAQCNVVTDLTSAKAEPSCGLECEMMSGAGMFTACKEAGCEWNKKAKTCGTVQTVAFPRQQGCCRRTTHGDEAKIGHIRFKVMEEDYEELCASACEANPDCTAFEMGEGKCEFYTGPIEVNQVSTKTKTCRKSVCGSRNTKFARKSKKSETFRGNPWTISTDAPTPSPTPSPTSSIFG